MPKSQSQEETGTKNPYEIRSKLMESSPAKDDSATGFSSATVPASLSRAAMPASFSRAAVPADFSKVVLPAGFPCATLPDQILPLPSDRSEKEDSENTKLSTLGIPTNTSTENRDTTKSILLTATSLVSAKRSFVLDGGGDDVDLKFSTKDLNENKEEESLFHQQQRDIASLIVQHEQSIGINGVDVDLNFSTKDFNENNGEESLFHQRQRDIASLIVQHEQSIGISKSGIGIVLSSDDEYGVRFWDSEEEEPEEEGSSIAASAALIPRQDSSRRSVEKIGSTFDYDSEEEELEDGKRDQGSAIGAAESVEESAFKNPPRAEEMISASVHKGHLLCRDTHSRQTEAKDWYPRNIIAVPPTNDLDFSEISTVSHFRSEFQSNRTPPDELSINQSKEFFEILETTKMKGEKIESFFFNNGMTVALGGLFFALNIIVGSHAAYQYTEQGGFTTNNDILWITLPIARVGGRLVTFNCAWLLITACKYFWTLIRSHVVPIVPIGFPIDDIMPKYHRFVALWIIICGCIIHTLPQIANYASGAIPIDDGAKIWTFGNGLASRQLLITGVLLTMIFIMFFLTTLKAFRKTAAGFRWFWWFHMGGIALAYPLLIVHGTKNGRPIFLYAALGPLVLYLIDIAMRQFNIAHSKILEWKTHNGAGQKIVELILECPPNFAYTPGQYVDLNFKPISKTEWHPFTIASSPSNDVRYYNGKQVNVLIFFIQAQGRWTEALFNYASAFDLSKATMAMEISIRGPHGAPAMNFFEYKHIIVVGSGVGVTPLLSVWQYMVDQGCSKVQDKNLLGRLSKFLTRSGRHCRDDKGVGDSRHSACSLTTLSKSKDDNTLKSEQEPSKFRLACSKMEDVMESLTLSIFLYGFFLIGETIIVVSQIFGHYLEVASMEIFFASFSLIVHIGTMIVSAVANNGSSKYCLLFKCWIEIMITLVDTLNLFLSIVFLRNNGKETFVGSPAMELRAENLLSDGLNRHLESQQEYSTRWIISLGAVSVFLHAIRIFHIFYTTLKPTIECQEQPQSKVSSIHGIFINRKYAGMQFCFEQLLKPLQEGLPRVFSLHLYGTRETTNDLKTSSLSVLSGSAEENSDMASVTSVSQSDSYYFHKGRPEWERIFRKALRDAQEANPDGGDSVGVFFCGSPAIAKCLRSAADKVNAHHQFTTKKKWGKASKCKIVIHVENF